MLGDLSDDSAHVLVNLLRGETEHVDALPPKHSVPLLVVLLPSTVATSINLYRECGGITVEIYDESVDDLMAAEKEAVEAIGAKDIPQEAFFLCHLGAEFFGPAVFVGSDELAADDPTRGMRQSAWRAIFPFFHPCPPREGAGG